MTRRVPFYPPPPAGFRWVFENQRTVDEDGDGIGTFYADIVLAPIKGEEA